MSTESNTSNTAHTIRMSEQDWNELLVTAVNAGYKSRTEYIRATLDRGRIEQSALPPAEIAPDNPRLMTPKIETEIRAELAARSAKIQQLETKWQETLDSLEVYSSDAAKFLARAETAEAELEICKEKWQASVSAFDRLSVDAKGFLARAEAAEEEIPRLKAAVQSATLGYSVAVSAPITEKKPTRRYSFASVLKHWPEARRNRYNKLPTQPTEWVNATIETLYDMLDELE